ncbi:MAG: DUF5946 family protein [Candidatus Margulisiibacteriota bacterium]
MFPSAQEKPEFKAKKCPECGALGFDGVEDCQAAFAKLIAKEFSNQSLFRAHRLTVDAYCLQHPEQYMVSSKSAAAHLAGMCWSLEKDHSLNFPPILKKWVDGARTYARVKPPPPLSRGELNLNHMKGISDPDKYFAAALEWSRSAWNAWSEHKPQARDWVEEAINE